MMAYVDGFLLPIPKKNVAAYRLIARKAKKVWLEHGALEYHECVGDDLVNKFSVPFTRTVKIKPGETVVLAWILYRSRAHRDRVNKKVIADPRMSTPPKTMPFDARRMVYGGFKVFV
jgi:uncharacterized protein YbaA (DUF1428 family)